MADYFPQWMSLERTPDDEFGGLRFGLDQRAKWRQDPANASTGEIV